MLKNMCRIMIVLGSIAPLFLIDRNTFKKFLPVTLFSTVIQFIEIFYYSTYKKWRVKGSPGALICDTLILLTGPYFVATLFSFQFSKGKLVKYMSFHTVAGVLYAFPIITFLKKLNFFKLRLSSMKVFVLTMINSLLNYLFQMFYGRLMMRDE